MGNTLRQRGLLFTEHFLDEGITDLAAWQSLDDKTLSVFATKLQKTFAAAQEATSLSEADTERLVIEPVLAELGWRHYLTQRNMGAVGRRDIPDFVLFADERAQTAALESRSPEKAYAHGLTLLEAKAFARPLDRRSGGAHDDGGVPSTQMLRYLDRAAVITERKMLWGILTNGSVWRLYWQDARSRAEEFFEVDLHHLLDLKGKDQDLFALNDQERRHWLKVFYLLFHPKAFAPQDGDMSARSLHMICRHEAKLWEEKVAQSLSEIVFHELFPEFAEAIAAADPQSGAKGEAYLVELREGVLILLYRLLFVFYAEDRELLPVRSPDYDDYGLRKPLREDIARRIDAGDVFSTMRSGYYRHFLGLCQGIDQGDPSIGLPAYNGGLFAGKSGAILRRAELSDAAFAPLFDKLSRVADSAGQKRWVNYRDLSVQQLGSIYERLLEFELTWDKNTAPQASEKSNLSIRPKTFARKISGSYYTPDQLVSIIIERTLEPLITDITQTFEDKFTAIGEQKNGAQKDLAALHELDPARRMLDLKICDPAMGSGHFLVTLVDKLADRILAAMAEVDGRDLPGWTQKLSTMTPAGNGEQTGAYTSPLAARIAEIRAKIKNNAADEGWQVSDEQLDDRMLVRRMILKRCVYGVDKNPMAVELAKVALWLHTFTVGAPLSFLDHHLHCGDSLFGEWVRPAMDWYEKRGALYMNEYIQKAMAVTSFVTQIEALSDADLEEVHASQNLYADVVARTRPLLGLLDLAHAMKWQGRLTKEDQSILAELLDNKLGNVSDIMDKSAGSDVDIIKALPQPAQKFLTRIKDLIAEEGFLHWQAAFPGVWDNWDSKERAGGFDAIIGNPPWDRIKLQEVEWFATRDMAIAKATKSERSRRIKALEAAGDPLYRTFTGAKARAEAMAAVARAAHDYPLLSSGDINLYGLFAERALGLLKPGGVAGLLVPSGIASDKTTAPFFKELSTGGRVNAFFDFENRRGEFFPDVDSRFKFAVFIYGAPARKWDHADFAFFLRAKDVRALEKKKGFIPLTPDDFANINPNTGTAPIFRNRRDAALTADIYLRFPVLVDRRVEPAKKVWDVKYYTMFHMTNDNHLFRTGEQLESDGFYPVAGKRWKKGAEMYVPLYVGKMIHHFDHRAASVRENRNNLKVNASSEHTSLAQYQDREFIPTPQYWVPEKKLKWDSHLSWTLAFRDIARSTDERTFISTLVPKVGFNNKLPLLMLNKKQPHEGLVRLNARAC